MKSFRYMDSHAGSMEFEEEAMRRVGEDRGSGGEVLETGVH